MTTSEFISAVRAAPENHLMFVDRHGHAVRSGYHLTELKAALFQTVDCGGHTNRWRETVVHLWVPANADDHYMTAAKFLKIFDKVCSMMPVDLGAEIRVEYGDENIFPSMHHVRSVTRDNTVTRVLLEPPRTTCKVRDRRLPSATDSCCLAAHSCC
jgi:hypothetical protein